MPSDIAILGAGSWGTALAVHLARVGHAVRLWAIEAPIVAEMRERRANAVYLPDVALPAARRADHGARGGARRRRRRRGRGAVARHARRRPGGPPVPGAGARRW